MVGGQCTWDVAAPPIRVEGDVVLEDREEEADVEKAPLPPLPLRWWWWCMAAAAAADGGAGMDGIDDAWG
jgi:hypothetical protein